MVHITSVTRWSDGIAEAGKSPGQNGFGLAAVGRVGEAVDDHVEGAVAVVQPNESAIDPARDLLACKASHIIAHQNRCVASGIRQSHSKKGFQSLVVLYTVGWTVCIALVTEFMLSTDFDQAIIDESHCNCREYV